MWSKLNGPKQPLLQMDLRNSAGRAVSSRASNARSCHYERIIAATPSLFFTTTTIYTLRSHTRHPPTWPPAPVHPLTPTHHLPTPLQLTTHPTLPTHPPTTLNHYLSTSLGVAPGPSPSGGRSARSSGSMSSGRMLPLPSSHWAQAAQNSCGWRGQQAERCFAERVKCGCGWCGWVGMGPCGVEEGWCGLLWGVWFGVVELHAAPGTRTYQVVGMCSWSVQHASNSRLE